MFTYIFDFLGLLAFIPGSPHLLLLLQKRRGGHSSPQKLKVKGSRRSSVHNIIQASMLIEKSSEEDAVLDGYLKECKHMINRKLWNKKECGTFKEPVDPIKLNIPDYHSYVKYPMDVGTVKKKLDSPGVYKSPVEVCDDLRLVWRNNATYNPPDHPVRNAGDILAAAWENAWAESKMEERWNQHLLQKDPEEKARSSTSHSQQKEQGGRDQKQQLSTEPHQLRQTLQTPNKTKQDGEGTSTVSRAEADAHDAYLALTSEYFEVDYQRAMLKERKTEIKQRIRELLPADDERVKKQKNK